MHMDGFERQLEQELARVLNPILMTPAPHRLSGWRDGRRGRLRIFQGGLSESGAGSRDMPRLMAGVAPVAITANSNLA